VLSIASVMPAERGSGHDNCHPPRMMFFTGRCDWSDRRCPHWQGHEKPGV